MSDTNSETPDNEEKKGLFFMGRTISKTTIGSVVFVFLSTIVQVYTIIQFLPKLGTTSGQIVLATCVVNLLIGPITVLVSFRKDKFSNFEDLMAELKEEANALGKQNAELSNTIGQMEDSVNELKDIEGALSSLTGSQEDNVSEIVRLVKESKEIASAQKSILKGNVLQMMVEIVLEAFQSSDSEVYLDDLGVEHLLMGLENVKDLHHDERAVKQKILYSTRSLKDILAIVNELVEVSKIGDDDI